MYNVIIADDEEIIRHGITLLFDKFKASFEVVGTFNDGKGAMEYIKSNKVDVVITDIRMNNVSGIELAKFIHENYPQIKVVIISGYQEFEYAKSAIEYNVENYLLKPTNFKEFSDVIEKIKTSLDERQNNKIQLKVYESTIHNMREAFFTDLYMGAIKNTDEIKKRYELLNLPFDAEKTPCCVLNIKLIDYDNYLKTKWAYGKDTFINAILNIMRENNSSENIFPVYFSDNNIKLIYFSDKNTSYSDFTKDILLFCEATKENFTMFLSLDIEISVDDSYENMMQIINESGSDNYENYDFNNKFLFEKRKLVISYINSGNQQEALCMIDDLTNNIKNLPISHIQGIVLNIFNYIIEKTSTDTDDEKLKNDALQDSLSVLSMTTPDEINKWMQDKIKFIMNNIDNDDDNSAHIINKAKKYIEENYNKDISLNDVADYLYFNPVYFSRFFKKNSGENFSDYLTKIRIDHAIELLRQNLTVEEISTRIGYTSVRYFSRFFKKYTGYAPKEYLRRKLNEE